MTKGLMIVISGPAGSGKGTVNAHLLRTGEYVYSISATTRAPRPGEVDGVNYYFITREDFEKRIAAGEMLEYTEYCGNYYGTPKKEALEVLESGKESLVATVITENGTRELELKLEKLSKTERDILLSGCLINYYRNSII